MGEAANLTDIVLGLQGTLEAGAHNVAPLSYLHRDVRKAVNNLNITKQCRGWWHTAAAAAPGGRNQLAASGLRSSFLASNLLALVGDEANEGTVPGANSL